MSPDSVALDLVKLQRQAVGILEKGELLARKLIDADRLELDIVRVQMVGELLNRVDSKGEMPQPFSAPAHPGTKRAQSETRRATSNRVCTNRDCLGNSLRQSPVQAQRCKNDVTVDSPNK